MTSEELTAIRQAIAAIEAAWDRMADKKEARIIYGPADLALSELLSFWEA